jgi:CubicO group peptidase (beta-lactamase class C family)
MSGSGTMPHSSPAAEGVAASGISRLIDALESAPAQDPHGLVVVRHGKTIASGAWAPFHQGDAQLVYSASKSFTATALGLAIDDGLLSLDDRVVDHFPEYESEVADRRMRSMLIRHLAAMATGHAGETYLEAVKRHPEDPVRGFLSIPPDFDPGSHFAYNQSATYTLAAIIQRKTGRTLAKYLGERIFAPMGLPPAGWAQYPPGRDQGWTGLYVSTSALAALGQLYLQNGVWQGRALLSSAWVAEATRKNVETVRPGFDGVYSHPDWRQGYGFQFWMSRHGYRADGGFGQYCLILPEQDAVIAITSESTNMQELIDIVWDNLLPAFDGPPSPSDDLKLGERLRHLEVPRLDLSQRPNPGELWDHATFVPSGGVCAEQPSLERITVTEVAKGWIIQLTDGGADHLTRISDDHWAVDSIPGDTLRISASGGWGDDGLLRVEILFLQTPHRLQVVCSLETGEFSATWRTFPSALGSVSMDSLTDPLLTR